MKVKNFEQFWKEEFTKYARQYANSPEVLVEMRNLAKRAWVQCEYTGNNADRDGY